MYVSGIRGSDAAACGGALLPEGFVADIEVQEGARTECRPLELDTGDRVLYSTFRGVKRS